MEHYAKKTEEADEIMMIIKKWKMVLGWIKRRFFKMNVFTS